MRKLLSGLALVIGVGFVAAASASAAGGPPNVVCHSGDIIEGTYHNVTVAKGNFCLVFNAVITVNVQANNAQQIGIESSTIAGNVQANNVTDNGWVCGSTIGGNVEVGNASSGPDEPGTW